MFGSMGKEMVVSCYRFFSEGTGAASPLPGWQSPVDAREAVLRRVHKPRTSGKEVLAVRMFTDTCKRPCARA